jgi:tetratricopeptide (TPR) repeat protein
MRKALVVTALFGILFTSVAWAQRQDDDEEGVEVGDYAPDIEAKQWLNVERAVDIPSLVELRGMVVVVFFWASWHEGGEHLLPYVNMLEYNPQIGRTGGVYFIGVTDADRKATQPLIEEAKVFFPVGVESKSAEEYGFRHGFGFVVIDPEGKVGFKGTGSGDLDGTVKAVLDMMQESPPTKTHPTEAKKCYRLIDEARDLIREGKYPKAFKAIREALRLAVVGDRLASQAFELIDLLDQLGYEKLSRLEPFLEEEKYEQAADLLRLVIRRFRGLDVYRDAKRLLKRFQEESEEFKEAAGKFEEEDAAARLYLEARDDLKAHRYLDSYKKLNKVVTEYPRTEAAEYAEAMIERMKRNREFWVWITDYQSRAECMPVLARARNLKRQGDYDEAEKLFRRIMLDYPNTQCAREAKQELIDLP